MIRLRQTWLRWYRLYESMPALAVRQKKSLEAANYLEADNYTHTDGQFSHQEPWKAHQFVKYESHDILLAEKSAKNAITIIFPFDGN